MDKHNRPYVCEDPGCEKVRGFTYSGGLRRHQREVHRQHGGPKTSRMCPYRDCKRSVGVGFSRKENLQEHLRRCHRGASGARDSAPAAATVLPSSLPASFSSQPGVEEAGKRRKGGDGERTDDVGVERELQKQIKRLRRDLQHTDDRLLRLEQAVETLSGS